jgi:hypothetical protein
MRRRSERKKKRVAAGIGFLGIAGIACLLAGWNAGGSQAVVLSASEIIAMRFPDSRYDAWDHVGALPARPADADDGLALFNPNPTMPAAVPTVATVSVTQTSAKTAMVPAQPSPLAQEAPKATMKLASVSARPVAPAVPKTRPGAVLNDAQITSIKTRLKLTNEQQEMWPAVEAALRDLSFEKKAEGGSRKIASYTGSIDPYSGEAQRLKSAAFPLIMSFSDDQKRELRVIAHVAGLEKLAAQF